MVVCVSWQERLCGKRSGWFVGSDSLRRWSVSLMAFALPVGRRRYARPVASSSHSTLLGLGVHRQRMLPLGVEKRQGTFALFGPLHAKCWDAARAEAPWALDAPSDGAALPSS